MGPYLFLSSVITAAVFLQRLEGRMIGSSQPIVVLAGNDIILPCHLEPTADLSDQTVEWSRPGSSVTYVHVHRDGAELSDAKKKSYVCRTELFVNELKNGNISLKLFRVKRSDEGTYKCSVPPLRIESSIELRVGVVSLPITSIVGTKDGGVDLQCESGGWYPEPEVDWLDGEGHVLSAGPTETLKDPDGTFTVRRHVTVERTATNRFTCRVHQQHISETRETVIHVPDSLFAVPPGKWITVVLGTILVIAVTAIAILLYRLRMRNDTVLQKIISETKIHNITLAALKERHINLRRNLADRIRQYFTVGLDLRKMENFQKNQENRIKKLINSPQPLVYKKEEIEELVGTEYIEAEIVEKEKRFVILKQQIKCLKKIEEMVLYEKKSLIKGFQQSKDELLSRLHGCFAKRNRAELEKKESDNSATRNQTMNRVDCLLMGIGASDNLLMGTGASGNQTINKEVKLAMQMNSSGEHLKIMQSSIEQAMSELVDLVMQRNSRDDLLMNTCPSGDQAIRELGEHLREMQSIKQRFAEQEKKESDNSATREQALKELDEKPCEAAEMSSDARPEVPLMLSVDGGSARRPKDEESKEAAVTCTVITEEIL